MNTVIRLVILLAIFAVILMVCGCSTWRGFMNDTGIKKPVTPPTPEESLWNAAKKSNWLVTLSVLGVAGGLFALANGSTKLGTSTMAASGVALFLALAVARYALWMAAFGLIGSVAAVLFSILARRRALVEIIKGVQRIKTEDNLGEYAKRGILKEEQSKTTEKIVGNIKNELKLAGEI